MNAAAHSSELVCENRFWQEAAETQPVAERQALQLTRLRETVARAGRVPFYERVLAAAGITPERIRSLDDLQRLPFTTKADLRENYPLGMLAVPRAEVARFHASSGTTGKPTFVAYTARDLQTWADLCARFLVAGGLRPEHTVHVAFGYGLFTGGFGLHYGIERVGAAVLPASSGNTPKQVMLLKDLGAQTLICTPSYSLTIAEGARAAGFDPRELPLEYAHFGGEMWTEDMRRKIEGELGLLAFNNYGLSEVIGPGVSGECPARRGMHVQEDHFLVECLNPQTLQPVGPGERGELVFTSLTKEAMPIIRYRTRDLATLDRSPCPCGRTTARMGRVVGRSDDMLIIRGVNVFPSQIEEALLKVEGAAPHYLIELSRPGLADVAKVSVEMSPGLFSDKLSNLQGLHDRIVAEIRAITGLSMEVQLVEPRSLERATGKATRVIDRRKLTD